MKLKKIGSIYHAQFRTTDGRTKSVTTHCTDKGAARKVVRESGIRDMEMAARAGRLTQQAIGHITAGRKLTLIGALTEYIDWMHSVGQSHKTIENNATAVNRWLEEMKLANLPPSAITEKHINPWINNPLLDSKANTRATLLAGIRSFLYFCSVKGWTIGNPAKLVVVNYDILSHAQKEPREKQTFTQLEVNRLLKHTEENGMLFWHFAVLVSREAGLRLSDICCLEWDSFSQAGYMIVWTRKKDRRVAVPISRQLEDFASTIPMQHNTYMFPEQRDVVLDPKKRAALSVQFGRLCARCEITGKSFHGLRHTLVTELRKQGKELKDVALIVGHSDESTTKTYDHSKPLRKLVLQ